MLSWLDQGCDSGARLATTTEEPPESAALADGARAVTIPHLDNRTPGPRVPRLCCARAPITLPALCGFRDPVAGPLDGSRGGGARLGAPIQKGRSAASAARPVHKLPM
jgi:hypothetical protein